MKVGTIVETNPQVSVKAVGFDRTLGSLEMTLRLRDDLAKKFSATKKTSNDLYTNKRAMAKLLKEAERVKKILSANSEAYAQVCTMSSVCFINALTSDCSFLCITLVQ